VRRRSHQPQCSVRTPEPSADLSPREAEIWRDAVRSMKAGWFTAACGPLLQVYCFHVTLGERFAQELCGLSAGDKRFSRLARLHRQTSKLVAMLRQSAFHRKLNNPLPMLSGHGVNYHDERPATRWRATRGTHSRAGLRTRRLTTVRGQARARQLSGLQFV
jgi:hypothetical protein